MSGEDFNINIQGQEMIRGHNAWNMQRTRTNISHDKDLISLDEQNGVLVHYRWVRENEMDMAPPVKFLEWKVKVGEVYETEPSQLNPATGNTTKWRSKVEAIEDVTVPAGTFSCVKVRLIVRDSKLGTKFADVEMWYGKGVGLVTRRGQFFGVYLVEQLLKYELN